MRLTFLIVFFAVTMISCGTVKENGSQEDLNYTIESLSIAENGFTGNIIVEVYDNQGMPVKDYQSILRESGEVIFDVPQSEHQCTFFKDGKKLTVEIRKKGYKTFVSPPFATDDELENAQFIKIILGKE